MSTKLTVDKKNNLIMRAKLDITSKANDLWYALTTKKKELGLSIGGFVKDYTLEYDKKQEKFKRVYQNCAGKCGRYPQKMFLII